MKLIVFEQDTMKKHEIDLFEDFQSSALEVGDECVINNEFWAYVSIVKILFSLIFSNLGTALFFTIPQFK